jgi:exopolysaccharide biosynthesis polyprenyl glycosylphosphotransferase
MTPPFSTESTAKASINRLHERSRAVHQRELAWKDVTARRKPRLLNAWQPFVDALLVLAAALAVFVARQGLLQANGILNRNTFLAFPAGLRFIGLATVYGAIVVLCCQTQGLYQYSRRLNSMQEAFALVRAVVYATVIAISFIFLSDWNVINRTTIVLVAAFTLVTLIGWRLLHRAIQEHRFSQGIGVRNVLILGAGRVGQDFAAYLKAHRELGLVVKGYLDHQRNRHGLVLGNVDDLGKIARQHFIDEIYVSIPSERDLVQHVALEGRRCRLDVKVISDLFDGLGYRAPVRYYGDYPIMEVYSEPIPRAGLFFKRVIDILGSSVALVLLSPLMLIIGLLVKLNTKGPAIYPSLRVGKKGRRFRCHKFRTMVVNADELKGDLLHMNERQGPFFKISNDPRITRLGKFLRETSLDELPQFWNVLVGDMSLVGPRPHPVDDCEKYSLRDLRRLDVTPGITGLWQVTARKDPSFETNLALDIHYIENWSVWLDLEIMLKTVPALTKGQ